MTVSHRKNYGMRTGPIYGLSLADGRIDYVAVFGRESDVVLEVGFVGRIAG